MIYNIIASGSSGNAVIYNSIILVDCGVSFKKIEPFIGSIQIILITHSHADHFNITTLKKIQFERPGVRIACGSFVAVKLKGFQNVDILEPAKLYNYGNFQISPFVLYHDVSNFGFRIFLSDIFIGLYKIFHATDTAHLQGITATDYDLYCIESNYDEETIIDKINTKVKNGHFSHEYGAINSHLSEQQARQFFFENKGLNSMFVRLHESKSI